MRTTKRIVSILLTVVMVACFMTVAPFTVSAAENEGILSSVKFKSVELGTSHTMAISEDGGLYTWGYHPLNKRVVNTPVREVWAESAKSISCSHYFDAAIMDNGDLYAWGYGKYGINSNFNKDKYIRSKILSGVNKVSTGEYNGAAITNDKELYIWGNGYFLGNGIEKFDVDNPITTIPEKIMNDVIDVSVGYNNCAAVKENGDLYAWGSNDYGQLGDGTLDYTNTPQKIMSNVKSVALGFCYSAAITENGELYMWGNNDSGQLGNGTTDDSYIPVKILDDVSQVSLGMSHSAAITNDGSLYIWGHGDAGALGNNLRICKIPTKIMSDVKQVSLGSGHSAAITKDGELYLWGSNSNGELGDGTLEDRYVPENFEIKAVDMTKYLTKKSSTYNNELSALCSELCYRSYENKYDDGLMNYLTEYFQCYDVQRELCYLENGYREPVVNFATTYAYINGEETKVMFIINRGTFLEDYDWNDVLTDIKGVFDGFSSAGKIFSEKFKEYFSMNFGNENTKIIITGHSLGGAVAGVMAQGIQEIIPQENIYVYTFASPNYVNNADKEYNNIFNIINLSDLVPFVPSSGISLFHKDTYGKLGTNLYFDKDYTKDFNFSLDIPNDFSEYFNRIGKNHNIQLYMKYTSLNDLQYSNDTLLGSIADILFFRCPVDIEIYDENNTLIAKTQGNKATYYEETHSILIQIYGDEKYVYTPKNRNLSVKVIGTDNGTMECGTQSLNGAGDISIFGTEYSNVIIEKDKSFNATLINDNDTRTMEIYVSDEDDQNILKVDQNGNEKPFIKDVSLEYENCYYDGTEKTPAVTVFGSNGTQLLSEKDFAVEYVNNTDIGTATVKVKGIGEYVGEISLDFVISENLYKLGDVDLDGAVSITDATEIQKYVAQLVELSDEQKTVADADGDGAVSIIDATQIQKYIAQLIDKLG